VSNSPWIETISGSRFEFYGDNPIIKIEDINHALSHLCRFTGHSRVFYSVAQHSLLVSFIVERLCEGFSSEALSECSRSGWGSRADLLLAALLHDATEAYIGDMNSPLKSRMGDYNDVEARLFQSIIKTFGLKRPEKGPPLHPSIKYADSYALKIEHAYLMPQSNAWSNLPEQNNAIHERSVAEFKYLLNLSIKETRLEFMNRFDDLYTYTTYV
jgi:5'-nucleotidase